MGINLDTLYTTDAGNVKFNVAERTNFWTSILSYLHSVSLLKNIKEGSIMDIIQNNADFPEMAAINIIKENNEYVVKIGNTNTKFENFWNESVQNAWTNLLKYYNNDKNIFTPWAIDDIKKADAAASYDFEQKFVKPWENIDSDDYKYVRGSDAFKFIIENPTHSQFTHSKDKNWIRLIMPMNPRRVEVEDLDRNFWVIGQSLSIISKILFDEDSPTKKIFNNILREITEQWENILYLWGEYELLTGRNSIVNLVLDLPNDGLHPYRKFDNFDKDTWSIGDNEAFSKYTAQLESRFNFLTHKYGKSKISLLVRKRELNYKKNYYNREMYPYYGYYDGSNWTWYPIFYSNTGNRLFRANINDYKYFVYACNMNTSEYGRYSVTNRPTVAVRIAPSIKQGGKNPKIAFNFYDAVGTMITNEPRLLRTYEGEIFIDESGVKKDFIQIEKTYDIKEVEPRLSLPIIAHRGYQTETRGTKPELDNTLPNFRRAIEADFDYIETDIRFGTNCCILSHSGQVEINGETVTIANLNKDGHWVEGSNDKRFPLLSDLLELKENTESFDGTKRVLKKPLYLEIKVPVPEGYKDLLITDIVNSKVDISQINWISFDADTLIDLASKTELVGSNTRLGYLVDSSHGDMTSLAKLTALINASQNQTKFKVFVDFNNNTLRECQEEEEINKIYTRCTNAQSPIPIEAYTIDEKVTYNSLDRHIERITSNYITPYTLDINTGHFDITTIKTSIYPGEVLTLDYQEWM